MMSWKILAVCGSFGRGSSNLKLLQTAVTLAPDTLELIYFDGLRDLPLFDPDVAAIYPLPRPVQRWKEAMTACDALLIASPEYGHSVPGGLKNGLDWLFCQWGALQEDCGDHSGRGSAGAGVARSGRFTPNIGSGRRAGDE